MSWTLSKLIHLVMNSCDHERWIIKVNCWNSWTSMCNICCNVEERFETLINWLKQFIIMISCKRVCVQIVRNTRLFWYIFKVLVLKVTLCIQMLLHVYIEMILTRTHLNAPSCMYMYISTVEKFASDTVC